MTPREIVDQMLENDHFSKWMNLELLEIRENYCRVSMKVKRDMLNGFSILHGGVAYSMADSAFAFASNSCGRVTVSIESSMNYFKSAKEGDILVAEAKPMHTGGKISHFEVTIKKETELYYKFTGVVYHTHKEYPIV